MKFTFGRATRPVAPLDNRGVAILIGLGNGGKHVYAGTVPDRVKDRRRAANKVARRSRRINRRTR